MDGDTVRRSDQVMQRARTAEGTREPWALRAALASLAMTTTLLAVACATSRPAGTPDSSVPSFETELGERVDRARSAALELREMLDEYYGGRSVLRETWWLQPGEEAYEQQLDALAERIARAFVWREPFVVGTIGSSVTAGHDNCHLDSYQNQLSRLMEPVWAAAEVPFEVRNAGQTGDCGDTHRNQVWCLRQLVGDDVDVTHYSWTYFEGREGEPFHEMFYRWSLGLPKAAAPQLLFASDCSQFSQLDRQLLADYAPFGADALCMEKGILAHGYPGKEWGTVGDGLHETTREGELLDVGDPRRSSLGVVYRNWHPGPLLFQTTADALADRYTAALLRALEWIEDCRDTEGRDPRIRWPREVASVRDRLPPPRACEAEWCDASRLPACVTYGDPVLGETEVDTWLSLESGVVRRGGESVGGWEAWRLPSNPRLVPEDERDLPGCTHPSACGGWRVAAGAEPGWLGFRLPDLEVGFVAVCCGGGKQCGQQMLDAGVEVRLDGEPPVAPPEVLYGKCLRVQERFSPGGAAGRRPVVLEVRFSPSDRPSPAISHVFGI